MKPDGIECVFDLGDFVIFTPDYPLASAYIDWGVEQGYPNRPTCASRQWWWDVGERKPANVNCNYLLDDRMRFYLPNTALMSATTSRRYIKRMKLWQLFALTLSLNFCASLLVGHPSEAGY